jgi:hypothetical protein
MRATEPCTPRGETVNQNQKTILAVVIAFSLGLIFGGLAARLVVGQWSVVGAITGGIGGAAGAYGLMRNHKK